MDIPFGFDNLKFKIDELFNNNFDENMMHENTEWTIDNFMEKYNQSANIKSLQKSYDRILKRLTITDFSDITRKIIDIESMYNDTITICIEKEKVEDDNEYYHLIDKDGNFKAHINNHIQIDNMLNMIRKMNMLRNK